MAKELKKASIFKRLGAYLIDYILMVMLISIISYPFTNIEKTNEIQSKATEIIEQYQREEITAEQYMVEYSDTYYKLSKSTGVVTFITIIVYVLYFIVFQFYSKGQTIGKKIFKIQVISDKGDLSMNQIMFRSLICNMILLNIINFGLMIFSSKIVYTSVSAILSIIQYLILFISLILTTTKEGKTIHDRIAHTRVISIN